MSIEEGKTNNETETTHIITVSFDKELTPSQVFIAWLLGAILSLVPFIICDVYYLLTTVENIWMRLYLVVDAILLSMEFAIILNTIMTENMCNSEKELEEKLLKGKYIFLRVTYATICNIIGAIVFVIYAYNDNKSFTVYMLTYFSIKLLSLIGFIKDALKL